MAGSYPDPPNHRIHYDRDGTVVARYNADLAFLGNLDQGTLNGINNESTGVAGTAITNGYWSFLFPVPHDITHVFANGQGGSTNIGGTVAFSTDTTNGVDGSWTAISGQVSSHVTATATVPRTTWDTLTGVENAKSIRFRGHSTNTSHNQVRNILLYGTPSEASDRLEVIETASQDRINHVYFDLGDRARNSFIVREFRVKNISSTLSANSVLVSFEALLNASPSLIDQHAFSTDGDNYLESINIGNLAPGNFSTTIHMRQSLLSNAALSVMWGRVVASAASWSLP